MPTMITGKATGASVHHADGTVEVYKAHTLVRLPNGRIEVHYYNGDVIEYDDEAAARAEANWPEPRLIFTVAQIAEQEKVRAWQRTYTWVNGAYQNEPYAGLAQYLTAVAAGDIATAAREAEAHIANQGYATGRVTDRSDLVIVRVKKAVKTKSGRLLVPGDLALAYPSTVEGKAAFSIFSARSGGYVLTYPSDVAVVARRG